MRLFVTGGAGYIGSVVAAKLLQAGHDVTVFDNLSTGHRELVPKAARFIQGDLLDRAAVQAAVGAGFDAVLHFAAKSLVGESAQKPSLYFGENVGGAVNLVDAMREAQVPSIVFSSTAAVYGEPEVVPIPEDAPPRPVNAYGASKLAIDQLLSFSGAAHGLKAVSLRYFNVGGAFGYQGERHTIETHVIPRILTAAQQDESFDVYGTDYPTPDGTAVRDYVHVADLADAHLLALLDMAERGTIGQHRIYNLGNGEGFSVRQVLEVARQVTQKAIPANERPRRAGDPVRLVASSEKVRRELGWNPERSDLASIISDAWSFMTKGRA
ncbi:UDP-glucose 4-epimerase GalE [Pendulispora rubella]|uniref:UDP-glucose 4-epimerase n=1 Tax=Pendulispora rubella TaxID=2741070 RepID=A0ABZ2LGS2_9BACT